MNNKIKLIPGNLYEITPRRFITFIKMINLRNSYQPNLKKAIALYLSTDSYLWSLVLIGNELYDVDGMFVEFKEIKT